jgi:hypothetical protein
MPGTKGAKRVFDLQLPGMTPFGDAIRRIDIHSPAEFDRPSQQDSGRNRMIRIVLAIPLVLMATLASAQQQGQDACARDVTRFCRARMNDGDSVVLACLKQNRPRLSKTCAKVLTDHGQ